MEFTPADFERLLMFEQLRKACEAQYIKDPLDSENLVKWGGSLLELSQFQSIPEAKIMLNDAIVKLEEALTLNPEKHAAVWCIGNAYTSQAFLTPDTDVAKVNFDKAVEYFQRAENEDPGNEIYRNSLESSGRALELHTEMYRHGMGQQMLGGGGGGGGPSSSSNAAGGNKKKKNNEFTYDVCGWVILGFAIVAWVTMAKAHGPPPRPM